MQKKNSWNILRVLTTNACNYRCIYCHNPEFLKMTEENYTPSDLANKLIKNQT